MNDDNERTKIGAQVDGLGVRVRLHEGDLVEGALVILKVVDSEGAVSTKTTWSEGMDWITRRGLIEVTRDSERIDPVRDAEEL